MTPNFDENADADDLNHEQTDYPASYAASAVHNLRY